MKRTSNILIFSVIIISVLLINSSLLSNYTSIKKETRTELINSNILIANDHNVSATISDYSLDSMNITINPNDFFSYLFQNIGSEVFSINEPTAEPTAEPTSEPTTLITLNPIVQTIEPSVKSTLSLPTNEPVYKLSSFKFSITEFQSIDRYTLEPTYEPTMTLTNTPTLNFFSLDFSVPEFQSVVTYSIEKYTCEPTFEPTTAFTNTPALRSFEFSTIDIESIRLYTNKPTLNPTLKPYTTTEPVYTLSSFKFSVSEFQSVVTYSIEKYTCEPTFEPTTAFTNTPAFRSFEFSTIDIESFSFYDQTFEPTLKVISVPTSEPTNEPTNEPTADESSITSPSIIDNSTYPTFEPTSALTFNPISLPSAIEDPTTEPSSEPTSEPTSTLSYSPSFISLSTDKPTTEPSSTIITNIPTLIPSVIDEPTFEPSSTIITNKPTLIPSVIDEPTFEPSSIIITNKPTLIVTSLPSYVSSSSRPSQILLVLPEIRSIYGTSNINSIIFSVVFNNTLSFPGTLYCATFNYYMSLSLKIADEIIASGSSVKYDAFSSTSTVVVNNLLPSTKYIGYCVMVNSYNQRSSFINIINTKQTIFTKCCKDIKFTNAPRYVYGLTSMYLGISTNQYIFTYALSVAPNENVDISPVISVIPSDSNSCNSINSELPRISPSTIRFTRYDTNLMGSFIISSNENEFECDYSIVLSSESTFVKEYSEVSIQVRILTPDSIKPPPVLKIVHFSDNGGSLAIYFDSATNKALKESNFPCSDLFDFVGATHATCLWTSSDIVVATFGDCISQTCASLMQGYNTLTLIKGTSLKASCAVNMDCSKYGSSDEQTILLMAPSNPVKPVVVFNNPTKYASCDPIILDISSTSGSGGRNFESLQWFVSNSSFNHTEDNIMIRNILDSFGVILTTERDLGLLTSGLTYTITLTATNFLGQATTGTFTFYIDSNSNIPMTTILGPSIITVKPNEQLSIYTSTTKSTCFQAESVLSFKWIILLNGIQQPVYSSSKSISKFFIASSSYSLQPGYTYTLSFIATAGATNQFAQVSSTSSILIEVIHGNIVAVISGGSSHLVSPNYDFVLDASQSYDEDGINAPLTFAWTCTYQNTDQYGISCDHVFTQTNSNDKALTITSATFLDNTIFNQESLYGFSVIVTGSTSRSQESSTVVVQLADRLSSTVTAIQSSLTRSNSMDSIVLGGSVQANGYSLIAQWDIYINNLKLPGSQWNSGTNKYSSFSIQPGEVSISADFPLLVSANNFNPGSVVTFRLSAQKTDGKYSAYSEIVININTPPSGGNIFSSPSEGIQLQTKFTIITAGWLDYEGDYPLEYDYSYQLDIQSSNQIIQSRSELNKLINDFAAGYSFSNYQVIVNCNIYDSMSASTLLSTSLIVKPNKNSRRILGSTNETSRWNQYLLEKYTISKDLQSPDALTKAVVNIAIVMNSNTCDNITAQFCDGLNRFYCELSTTPQTCGQCKEGFVGVLSDSNLPCYNDQIVLNTFSNKTMENKCSSDYDCALYEHCNSNFTCAVVPLYCPSINSNICSGNGLCEYKDSRGLIINKICLITDVDCTARCQCVDGFGGLSCAIPSNAALARSNIVDRLCGYIFNIQNTSDVSEGLLKSLINTLLASYDSEQVILPSTKQVCQSSMLHIAELVSQGKYLKDDLYPNIVSLSSKFVDNDETSSGEFINTIFSLITKGMTSNIINGQQPYEATSDNVRMLITKKSISEINKLSAPLTNKEKAYSNSLTNSIEFANGETSYFDTGSGYVSIIVTLMGKNPFQHSNITLSKLFRFEFTSKSNQKLSINQNNNNANTISKPYDYFITQQFIEIMNFNVSSSNASFPSCIQYDSNSQSYLPCSQCNISSYTSYNVSYGCYGLDNLASQSNSSISKARRYLSDSNNGGTTTFTSLSKAVQQELQSTLSQNPFQFNLNSSKPIIILVNILVFFILLGYWYFARWDYLDQGYLVYAKAEVDRLLFLQKQKELVYRYADSRSTEQNHQEYNYYANPMKRLSVYNSYKKLNDNIVQSNEFLDYTYVLDNPFLAQKNDITLKNLLITNTISSFLDSVMPKGSIKDNSISPWLKFLKTILRNHLYFAMFYQPSLRNTRVVRWTNCIIGILSNMFIDTLFYSIFYPDTGTCENYNTKSFCVSDRNMATNKNICSWKIDESLVNGGKCSSNPPPSDYIFILVIVMITIIISIPLSFLYDVLLWNFCVRRPILEYWGISSDRWFGREKRSYFGKSDKDGISSIKKLFDNAETIKKKKLNDLYLQFKISTEEKTQLEIIECNEISEKVYEDFSPPSVEAERLILEVERFFLHANNKIGIPWKTCTNETLQHAQIKAIQNYMDINPDGSSMPISLWDRCWYGTYKNKLISKITAARYQAMIIKHELHRQGKAEQYQRDVTLIQYFVLEQFTAFKRFILSRQLFLFSVSSPLPIVPSIWLLSCLFIAMSILFFLYWTLLWGVSQGSSSLNAWGINFGVSIAQEIFIIQPFRVFVVYILAMTTINQQLQYIARVLTEVALQCVQEDQPNGSYQDIAIIQHISPSCRAARFNICNDLVSAKILRCLHDGDKESCNTHKYKYLPVAVFVFILLSVLIGVINETFSEVILDAFLPFVLNTILIANYYIYLAIGLLIIVPYVLLMMIYTYKSQNSKNMKNSLVDYSSKDSSNWNYIDRTTLRTPSYDWIQYCKEYLLTSLLYITHTSLWFQSTDELGLNDENWVYMNFPYHFHGKINPNHITLCGNNESRKKHATISLDKIIFPNDIVDLSNYKRWSNDWQLEEKTSAYTINKHVDNYIHRVLTRAITYRTLDIAIESDHMNKKSMAVTSFKLRNTITSNANDALNRMFINYQLNVLSSKMLSVKESDSELLFDKYIYNQRNIRVYAKDLYILLKDVWKIYHPLNIQLNHIQIDEIIELFQAWIKLQALFYESKKNEYNIIDKKDTTTTTTTTTEVIDNLYIRWLEFQIWFLSLSEEINNYIIQQQKLEINRITILYENTESIF